MDRKNKPSSISAPPTMAQPIVDLKDNVLTAKLPSGDSTTVYLYGATVTSWKTSSGAEQLFLSDAAVLNGSKPIRGGIPLVFPVFGPPPADHATSSLPQHGFARNSLWEYMGKSSEADDSVKLDFGLSTSMLDEKARKAWSYEFGLVYSVTLSKGRLETQMHVQNKGNEAFEFQCLFHTYLNVKVSSVNELEVEILIRWQDISKTTVTGLAGASYIDKVRNAQTFKEESSDLPISGETDRVYTPKSGSEPILVKEEGQTRFVVTRDAMPDVTVWNGWEEKIKGMGDFEPKDGWKRYLCIEPGSVNQWTKLETGDAWEGGCVMECRR